MSLTYLQMFGQVLIYITEEISTFKKQQAGVGWSHVTFVFWRKLQPKSLIHHGVKSEGKRYIF